MFDIYKNKTGVLSMSWLGIEAATSNALKYQTKILSVVVFVETKETIELLGCLGVQQFAFDNDLEFEIVYTAESNCRCFKSSN